MKRRFQNVQAKELVADTRTADERRVSELMLAMVIGRSRQQMHGTRTPEVMRRIVEECQTRLPWEIPDWE
jgi:hypothetical protein